MSLLGGLAVGAQIAGNLAGIGIDLANYKLQKDNYEYMKGVQEKSWMREDTAVQRRIADLKAAGINPILAAGQAAGSSSPIKLESPHMGDVGGKIANMSNVLGIMQMKNNVAMQDDEKDILRYKLQQEANNAYMSNFNTALATEPQGVDLALNRITQAKEQDNLKTEQMRIETDSMRSSAKILKDLGYSGKLIGILKDILGPVYSRR